MDNEIWSDFLTIVAHEQGSRVVETWLKAVSIERWDSSCSTLYIQSPNAFVRDWIKSNYLQLFKTHLARLLNVDSLSLMFLVRDESYSVSTKVEKTDARGADSNEQSLQSIKPAHLITDGRASNKYSRTTAVLAKPTFRPHATLNNNYVFDNLVVGAHNSLAFAAARAVVEQPGLLYNPLFIYGPSGLGKTHLLHAIGNELKTRHPQVVLLYQTADRFVSEFINAIRFDKMNAFKERYRTIDVLLIDDIQFFSNKESTQEAFFHIFNTLHESGRQIVFTSDSYPKDIKGLAERLRTRLEWGLVADITVPTHETKIAILKKKAEGHHIELAEDVAHCIASAAQSNIRELEGALIRVIAFATLTGKEISLDLARKVLTRLQESSYVQSDRSGVSMEKVAQVVGSSFSYNLKELRVASRNKQIALARQVAMFYMKELTGCPLSAIAQFFNKKDHTTVVHAIQKITKLSAQDHEFREKIQKIKQQILM
jgi:chromosomal replication initiator protein